MASPEEAPATDVAPDPYVQQAELRSRAFREAMAASAALQNPNLGTESDLHKQLSQRYHARLFAATEGLV